MSIIAYTGLPGSGKSYSVVEHQIIPALKQGRVVVTNVPLRMDRVAELKHPGTVVEFPVEAVSAEPHKIYDYVSPGCVFVLDEVWRLFPQGQQANKVPDEYKKLLAEHRHMVDGAGNSTQIVFVVQDLANIGAFARRLVENTFVTTKLSFVGLSGSFRVDVFHGGQTGATPPVSNRLRMITGRYRKEIFALYKSHTMAQDDSQEGANEAKIDKRANVLRRPAFVVGAVLVPVLLWFSLHTFAKAFHGFSPSKSVASHDLVGPAGSPSGARGVAGPVLAGEVHSALPSPIRVLLEVADRRNLADVVVYLTDGLRVYQLGGDQCRRLGRHLQCLWQGSYYDGVGFVERAAAGPLLAGSAGGPGGRP